MDSDQMEAYAREAVRLNAGAVPEGMALVPNWKGYALLGTGNYVIEHSADFHPELGAEVFIRLATDEDKAGNRQIGESRDTTRPDKPVYPEEMVLRIGFLNERGLFALEDQLQHIRKLHFPPALAAAPEEPAQPEPKTDCEWTNCPHRVGDRCCNDELPPAQPQQERSAEDESELLTIAYMAGYEKGKDAGRAEVQERKPLSAREVELIDGMIEVQLLHAQDCDRIANRVMAEKQKGWDMERVELLRKLKAAHGIKGE